MINNDMWIFNSATGDPMLLDSETGLRALHESFLVFLASTETTVAFSAETGGNPSPYQEFLGGLRVQRTNADAQLRFTEDRWLQLSGRTEDLSGFAERILVTEEQGHRHWYGAPVSLIFEADDYEPPERSAP